MLTDDTLSAIQRLASGSRAEALVAATTAVASVSRRHQELQAELAMLEALVLELTKTLEMLPWPPPKPEARANASLRRDPSLLAEQSLAVQECADEIDREAPYRAVRTQDIADRIRARGVEPPSPKSLGLILAHTGQWERRGSGVYTRRKP